MNTDSDIGYSDQRYMFSSVSPGEYEDSTLKEAKTSIFPAFLTKPLFVIIDLIRGCIQTNGEKQKQINISSPSILTTSAKTT
jgi:hypothetical protein